MMWFSSVLCLLLLTSAFADDESPTTTEVIPSVTPENLPKPIIKFLHYDTDVQNRYAKTVVSSNVANPANKSQEVHFGLVLPETAFISGFVMIIKNKEYNAYVKEKEEAKQDYDAAVAAGQSAAHIQQDVRDSNRFQVSVNVEAEGKVLFKLTYEELLSRTLGLYRNVINVNPGQIVKDLVVKVNVKEPVPITHFSVPKFRTKNEIASEKEEDDKLAVINHNTKDKPNEASVTWSPSTDDQIAIAKEGLKGQLIVEYDVSREKSSQILLDEGYFVHFFTPNESAPSLAKHVVFVLDISGSMNGRKIEQLIEAMVKILSDLNEKDYFSIVLFSSDVIVWSPSKTTHLFNSTNRYSSYNSDPEIDSIIKKRDDTEILQANPNNIEEAKKFVKKIYATDATNIMGGLREGIQLINKGLQKLSKETNKVDLPQPIIVFLTDGEPNVDISDPNEIVKKTVELNEIKVPIFSLAFGDGADLQFLRRLSLKNFGFARNIYEASDAALQLNNFYKEISSPLMADVNFSYLPGQVKNGTLTTHQFPVLFRGSEIVIAGKLEDENSGSKKLDYDFSATKNSDGTIDYKGPSMIAIDFIPRPLPSPEANKTFGHLEKLWGYLTIKQLLDKDSSDKNDPKSKSPEKEQALKLALKYSFVTPLTSLVVVKPNETDSNVNPEKASASPPSFAYGGMPGAGGFGGSFMAPALMGSVPLSVMSSGASYGGPASSFAAGFRPPPPMVPYPAGPGPYLTTPFSGPITATPFVLNEAMTTDMTDSSATGTDVPPTPGLVQGGVKQVPVSNITWLANYVANHDHFVIDVPNHGNFTVGFNETDTLYGDCNVPNQFTGHCRHLQYCTLSTFVNTIDEYMPYFCPITNGFAGVCCPANP